MAIYIISFGTSDYNDDELLRKKISSIGATYPLFENTILLKTELTSATHVNNQISSLSKHTHIIITELTSNSQGWLPNDIWVWAGFK